MYNTQSPDVVIILMNTEYYVYYIHNILQYTIIYTSINKNHPTRQQLVVVVVLGSSGCTVVPSDQQLIKLLSITALYCIAAATTCNL